MGVLEKWPQNLRRDKDNNGEHMGDDGACVEHVPSVEHDLLFLGDEELALGFDQFRSVVHEVKLVLQLITVDIVLSLGPAFASIWR